MTHARRQSSRRTKTVQRSIVGRVGDATFRIGTERESGETSRRDDTGTTGRSTGISSSGEASLDVSGGHLTSASGPSSGVGRSTLSGKLWMMEDDEREKRECLRPRCKEAERRGIELTSSKLALARMMTPASRSCWTTKASPAVVCPRREYEPAVVFMRSEGSVL